MRQRRAFFGKTPIQKFLNDADFNGPRRCYGNGPQRFQGSRPDYKNLGVRGSNLFGRAISLAIQRFCFPVTVAVTLSSWT